MSPALPSLAEALAADPEARSRHLLVLRAGTEPAELGELAAARFTAARWEALAGSVPSADDDGPRVLRLSRHSSLLGPFAVGRSESMDLQLPVWGELAFVVRSPRERGEPPWEVGGDRDGLKRVFAAGMPTRDEGRVVEWLVDAARHLEGAVRFGEPAAVVVPDPLAAVDVTVYSGVWLEPEAALHVAQRLAPQSRLAMDAHEWTGPARPDLSALGITPLPEPQRLELHELVDAEDLEVLSGPDVLDGYGVEIDLDIDGLVAIEAFGEEEPPPAVLAMPWASGGVVAYRVSWVWEDEEEAHLEKPPMHFRVARGRAASLVEGIVRGLAAATEPSLALTPAGFRVRGAAPR